MRHRSIPPQEISGRASQMPVKAACVYDIGCVRDHNEDSYLLGLDQGMFIVSDGMGGHQAGETASQFVVLTLPHLLEQRVGEAEPTSVDAVEQLMQETVLELSRSLRAEGAGKVGLKGLGATLALVWLRDLAGTAYLAHLGDSRVYLYRGAELVPLTEDHTIVRLLLTQGEISPQEAPTHPARGQLSRYVGMEEAVYPDVAKLYLTEGDRLLLCTDGLHGSISDELIAGLLGSAAEPLEACRLLVDAAKSAGGTDNITAMVVDWMKE